MSARIPRRPPRSRGTLGGPAHAGGRSHRVRQVASRENHGIVAALAKVLLEAGAVAGTPPRLVHHARQVTFAETRRPATIRGRVPQRGAAVQPRSANRRCPAGQFACRALSIGARTRSPFDPSVRSGRVSRRYPRSRKTVGIRAIAGIAAQVSPTGMAASPPGMSTTWRRCRSPPMRPNPPMEACRDRSLSCLFLAGARDGIGFSR